MRKFISKKILISVIAMLVLFATAFAVLSFTLADEVNEAGRTIVADATGPSSIIDYIIENSHSTTEGVDTTYHIVELSSSSTPSSLKSLVAGADYKFKNLVLNGNKSSGYTRDYNESAAIEYRCFNAIDGATCEVFDSSLTACTNADIVTAIQKADFIYLSNDPLSIYSDGHDISEEVKIALSAYATGDKKPIMVDSHNQTQEIINLTSKNMKAIATSDFATDGATYSTYKWDSSKSAAKFMDVTNMADLYLPIDGNEQKSKWVAIDNSPGVVDYMAKVLTITKGETTLTDKLKAGITEKYSVPAGQEAKVPKPDDTYNLPSSAELYQHGYQGRAKRPTCIQFDTFTLDATTIADLADSSKVNLGEYDFIVIENDTGDVEFVNNMDSYNALIAAMRSNIHILYNKALVQTKTDKDIVECTAKNFNYVYDKIATSADKAKYGFVLVGNRSKTSTYSMSRIPEGVKDIADIINAGTFRGIGGNSSDDSSNIYTALEIEPCYPINLTLAKAFGTKNVSGMTDPLSIYENSTFTFYNENHKGGLLRDSADGFYYLRTDGVLDATSDEISFDEENSVTTMIGNNDYSSITSDNARRLTDYYDWALSKAKIAHALDLSYDEVRVVHMSSTEFAASKDTLLDNYDMIYIGGNTSAVNPSAYIGVDDNYYSMYRHNGKAYTYPNVKGQKNGTVGVLTGNDITDDKLKELKEYVTKGMPVVFDSMVSSAFNNGGDIDPDSNMYDFLSYASSKAYSSTTLWDFDEKDTIKVSNVGSIYGTTYNGYATVFAGRSYPYDDENAYLYSATATDAPAKYHSGDEYINEEELAPLIQEHQRPRLAVTSMPTKFIEGNSNTWLTSSKTAGTKLNWSYKVDGATDGSVSLYIDDDSNNRFTESEKRATGSNGSVTFTLGPDYYGPVYWKLVAEGSNGTSASTTGICKIARREDQDKMVVDLLEIQPPMTASETNKCTLIFCTECQQTRAFLYGNRSAEVGKYSHDSVSGLSSGFHDNSRGFSEGSDSQTFAEVKTTIGTDPLNICDLNESNVPADVQSNINNYIAFQYMNNEGTGYNQYTNILGLHEHKFGIVKYYDNLTVADLTGVDDWDSNWFDELRYDYDVNMTTMTTRQYEKVVDLVNSVYSGRTDAEVAQIKAEFEVREADYKLYYDCMRALINGNYETKISMLNKSKFSAFMTTTTDSSGKRTGLGLASTDLDAFKTAGPNIDTYLKAADVSVFSDKTPAAEAAYEIAHETDSSIPYDERNYYDIYSLRNSFDDSTASAWYNDYNKLYQVWRNAKMYEIYFKNQYVKYAILSGVNNDSSTYKSDSYKNTFNIKDAFNCVVFGASDDFNGDDLNTAAANNAILDYIDDEGNVILFHDTLTARGDTENMTAMLSDAFGQNARHLEYVNTDNTEVENIVTVKLGGKTKKVTFKPSDGEVELTAQAGDVKLADKVVYLKATKYQNPHSGNDTTKSITISSKLISGDLIFYTDNQGFIKEDWNNAVLQNAVYATDNSPHNINLKLYLRYKNNDSDGFNSSNNIIDNSGNFGTQLRGVALYMDDTPFAGIGNMNGNVISIPNGKTSGFTFGEPTATAYSGTETQHDQTLKVKYIDKDGNAISGETVTATNRVDGSTQTAVTDVNGYAEFIYSNYNDAVTNMTGVRAKAGYKNSEYYLSPMTQTPNINTLTLPLAVLTFQDEAHWRMPYRFTTYDSNAENSEYGYHGAHDMRDQIHEGGKALTDKTSQTNKGIVTMYPFTIGSEMKVSNTVPQSYSVDIEDPDVTVYYTLAGGSPGTYSSVFAADPHNGQDNYFIYQNGSITYTGAGHASITGLGRNNNDERRLFINIIVNSARKSTAGPDLHLYDVDSSMAEKDSDGNYTNLWNNFIKVSNDDCDYVAYIEDIADPVHFTFLPEIAKGATFSHVDIFFDINRDGSNVGVYNEGEDVPIFSSDRNEPQAVDSERLKRITAVDIGPTDFVGDYQNRLGLNIDVTSGLSLDSSNNPNLILKDSYFDNMKKAYIVVTVTDSKGGSVSRTLRVQFKPELIDLN